MSKQTHWLLSATAWYCVKFAGALSAAGLAASAIYAKGDGISSWIPGLGMTTIIAVAEFSGKRIDEKEKAIRVATDRKAAEAIAKAEARSDQIARQIVTGIIKQLRIRFFEFGDAPIHKTEDRITLFVCRERVDNGVVKKRLEIFARAGAYADSTCSWDVSDNESDECRGIAGKIWLKGTQIFQEAACEYPKDDDLGKKLQYAESLGISVAEAERLRLKSISFTGFQCMTGGDCWGVILVDSKRKNQILQPETPESPKTKQEKTRFREQEKLLKQYADILCLACEGIEL